MKNFNIIETYEDFKKCFLATHDYAQKESPENQDKTCKYFYKKILFLTTTDGYILELDNTPNINKTLWYDDETPTPEKTENYFLNYNISTNLPYRSLNKYLEEKERFQKNGCASGAYDYKGIYFTNEYINKKRVGFDFTDDKRYFKRYLTPEEEQELINFIKDLQVKYIDRLKKYYKRFANNIHVSGYWANR